MGLLYKDKKDIKYSVEIKTNIDGTIGLEFSSDCGKFGADEVLVGFKLPIEELLNILSKTDYES